MFIREGIMKFFVVLSISKFDLIVLTLLLVCGNLFAQNPAGMALNLDGYGDYAVVPDPIGLDFGDTNNFTIEFWFRSDSSQPSNLVNKWQKEWQGEGWKIDLLSASYGDLQLNFTVAYLVPGLAQKGFAKILVDIPSGVTYHFAVTVDETHQSRKLYLNGKVYYYIYEWDIWYAHNLDTPGISIGIGAKPHQIDESLYFDGIIDELRIWNVVRDSSQIRSTANTILGPEYYTTVDSGLIGYWKFDKLEDLGINGDGIDDIRDLSINGNHGDLVGDAILVTSDIPVSINEYSDQNSTKFYLSQNYPNPLNLSTTIEFTLPVQENVQIDIYNVTGQQIKTLLNRSLPAGQHKLQLNAENLSSGIYFYRIEAGKYSDVKKMILLK